MFGIGIPELLLILAVALIVIGPKKLPELAQQLGRAMREFKKATTELKEHMQFDDLQDVRNSMRDMDREIKKPFQQKTEAEKKSPIDVKPSDLSDQTEGNVLKQKEAKTEGVIEKDESEIRGEPSPQPFDDIPMPETEGMKPEIASATENRSDMEAETKTDEESEREEVKRS